MINTMLSSDVDLEELAREDPSNKSFQVEQIRGKFRDRLLQCRYIDLDVPQKFSQQYVALMILNTMFKNVSKADGKKHLLSSFNPQRFAEILSPLTKHIGPPDSGELTKYISCVSLLRYYSQSALIHRPLDEMLEEGHIKVLSNVLPTVFEWKLHDETHDLQRIQSFQANILKLCVDRTNDDPETSTSIASYRSGLTTITEVYVNKFRSIAKNKDPEADLTQDVEILVLSGILISNMFEFSETARNLLRTQRSGGVPLLTFFMDLFADRHEKLELVSRLSSFSAIDLSNMLTVSNRPKALKKAILMLLSDTSPSHWHMPAAIVTSAIALSAAFLEKHYNH